MVKRKSKKTFGSPKYWSKKKRGWVVEDDKGNRLPLVDSRLELGYGGCGAIEVKEHIYKKICRRKR